MIEWIDEDVDKCRLDKSHLINQKSDRTYYKSVLTCTWLVLAVKTINVWTSLERIYGIRLKTTRMKAKT